MAATPGGYVILKITKPVSHPPYNLGYTVGEEALVSEEVSKLLIQDGRASLIDPKEGSPAKSSERAVSPTAKNAEKR